MGIGSVLVGLAALVVLAAYVALPFRSTSLDVDRAIEVWASQDRNLENDDIAVDGRFCTACGRQAQPDDRFCSGCGTELRADS